jgi:hypothetical protein
MHGNAKMKLKLCAGCVAITLVLAGAAIAQTFQSAPIKFRRAFFDTADRGNIEWIVADGEITAETPKEFRRFLSVEKIQPGTPLEVYLHSPGGNLIGGIQLGEIIREFRLGTRVARTVANGPAFKNGAQPETDAPGVCYSACAFAFLAGKWRIAEDHSIGVHQSYFKEALTEPNAPKFTARDFSAEQLIEGLTIDYVVRMGVDPKFLTYAARTAPTNLYVFNSDEMSLFGITRNDLEYMDWNLEASGSGLVAVSKTRSGERTATLYCSQDKALRLSIDLPNPFIRDTSVDWFVKLWQTASLFGADIPLRNISARISPGRLVLQLLIPPSLRTSDNNWLPDGKTAAWYVQEIQGIRLPGSMSKYDPTSAEWETLTPEDKQFRLRVFEKGYKDSFRSLPTYAADGKPIVPRDLPRHLLGLQIWAGPGFGERGEILDHHIPGRNFLTYSKLISRNCI